MVMDCEMEEFKYNGNGASEEEWRSNLLLLGYCGCLKDLGKDESKPGDIGKLKEQVAEL